MAKVKFTKTELKKQRDALKQFERFLPTLQLKKQQLQMEMRNCQTALESVKAEEKNVKDSVSSWISMFGEKSSLKKFEDLVSVKGIDTSVRNIAGVEVPVFENIDFEIKEYDLFSEDVWIDDAINIIKQLITINAKMKIIEEQYRLIQNELRVTTQRVNLFEKVKIPECKENIRIIRVYLGDMDTAAVGRSKIAKKKSQEKNAA